MPRSPQSPGNRLCGTSSATLRARLTVIANWIPRLHCAAASFSGTQILFPPLVP